MRLFFWAFATRRAFRYIFARLNFPRSKKLFPNPISRPRIPFPVPLAKDAASIPNALGYEQRAASFGQKCSQLIAHCSYPIFNFPFSIFGTSSDVFSDAFYVYFHTIDFRIVGVVCHNVGIYSHYSSKNEKRGKNPRRRIGRL